MALRKLYILSYVPLGFGSPQFQYLANNISKIKSKYSITLIETFRFWIPIINIDNVNFERKVIGYFFGKYLNKLPSKNILFRVLNYINSFLSQVLFGTKIIFNSYCNDIIVIVTEPKFYYIFFSKKTKIIEYNLEVWEEETKSNNKLFLYRKNVEAVIFPQKDRLELSRYNYSNQTRFYLIENCCNVEHDFNIFDGKYKNKKVIFSGRIGAGGSFHQLKAMINFFELSEIEVHLAGNFECSIENEALSYIRSKNNVIYHGLLKNSELRELIRSCNIGLITWLNNSINTKYCAPNKLYEYMSEGLYILSLDNYSMHEFCSKYKFGYVFKGDISESEFIDIDINKVRDIGLSNHKLIKEYLNYDNVSRFFIENEL